MNALHNYYAAGLYERQQEEERQRREAELQEQITQQASTNCTDSQQCASGFACIGGRCAQIDPTGATGSGGTAGCGAAPGGSGGLGGGGTGGSGCGGPAASSGGATGSIGGISACSTSSAGSCTGHRGPANAGGSGGGGGEPCGDRCCRCGPSGCSCTEGECPPPPEKCSRFCTEASGLGSNVMSCGPKDCGQCQYCDDTEQGTECKQDRAGADCRCGYECPGCMKCNFNGNCLIANCEPPENPPEPENCEPNCETVWDCDESGDGCVTYEKCDDLPPECEACDCNCNDECPPCQICGSDGKCSQDPACDKSKLYRSTWTLREPGYTVYVINADCSPNLVNTFPDSTQTVVTGCGPLPHTLRVVRACEWSQITTAVPGAEGSCPAILPADNQGAIFQIVDGDGLTIASLSADSPNGWGGGAHPASTSPGCGETPSITNIEEC